eukprot:Hpha_TRINITY_DN15054_c0_g3::TRINITY_DN15054_c0_g3_i1::g.125906::m.125906
MKLKITSGRGMAYSGLYKQKEDPLSQNGMPWWQNEKNTWRLVWDTPLRNGIPHDSVGRWALYPDNEAQLQDSPVACSPVVPTGMPPQWCRVWPDADGEGTKLHVANALEGSTQQPPRDGSVLLGLMSKSPEWRERSLRHLFHGTPGEKAFFDNLRQVAGFTDIEWERIAQLVGGKVVMALHADLLTMFSTAPEGIGHGVEADEVMDKDGEEDNKEGGGDDNDEEGEDFDNADSDAQVSEEGGGGHGAGTEEYLMQWWWKYIQEGEEAMGETGHQVTIDAALKSRETVELMWNRFVGILIDDTNLPGTLIRKLRAAALTALFLPLQMSSEKVQDHVAPWQPVTPRDPAEAEEARDDDNAESSDEEHNELRSEITCFPGLTESIRRNRETSVKTGETAKKFADDHCCGFNSGHSVSCNPDHVPEGRYPADWHDKTNASGIRRLEPLGWEGRPPAKHWPPALEYTKEPAPTPEERREQLRALRTTPVVFTDGEGSMVRFEASGAPFSCRYSVAVPPGWVRCYTCDGVVAFTRQSAAPQEVPLHRVVNAQEVFLLSHIPCSPPFLTVEPRTLKMEAETLRDAQLVDAPAGGMGGAVAIFSTDLGIGSKFNYLRRSLVYSVNGGAVSSVKGLKDLLNSPTYEDLEIIVELWPVVTIDPTAVPVLLGRRGPTLSLSDSCSRVDVSVPRRKGAEKQLLDALAGFSLRLVAVGGTTTDAPVACQRALSHAKDGTRCVVVARREPGPPGVVDWEPRPAFSACRLAPAETFRVVEGINERVEFRTLVVASPTASPRARRLIEDKSVHVLRLEGQTLALRHEAAAPNSLVHRGPLMWSQDSGDLTWGSDPDSGQGGRVTVVKEDCKKVAKALALSAEVARGSVVEQFHRQLYELRCVCEDGIRRVPLPPEVLPNKAFRKKGVQQNEGRTSQTEEEDPLTGQDAHKKFEARDAHGQWRVVTILKVRPDGITADCRVEDQRPDTARVPLHELRTQLQGGLIDSTATLLEDRWGLRSGFAISRLGSGVVFDAGSAAAIVDAHTGTDVVVECLPVWRRVYLDMFKEKDKPPPIREVERASAAVRDQLEQLFHDVGVKIDEARGDGFERQLDRIEYSDAVGMDISLNDLQKLSGQQKLAKEDIEDLPVVSAARVIFEMDPPLQDARRKSYAGLAGLSRQSLYKTVDGGAAPWRIRLRPPNKDDRLQAKVEEQDLLQSILSLVSNKEDGGKSRSKKVTPEATEDFCLALLPLGPRTGVDTPRTNMKRNDMPCWYQVMDPRDCARAHHSSIRWDFSKGASSEPLQVKVKCRGTELGVVWDPEETGRAVVNRVGGQAQQHGVLPGMTLVKAKHKHADDEKPVPKSKRNLAWAEKQTKADVQIIFWFSCKSIASSAEDPPCWQLLSPDGKVEKTSEPHYFVLPPTDVRWYEGREQNTICESVPLRFKVTSLSFEPDSRRVEDQFGRGGPTPVNRIGALRSMADRGGVPNGLPRSIPGRGGPRHCPLCYCPLCNTEPDKPREYYRCPECLYAVCLNCGGGARAATAVLMVIAGQAACFACYSSVSFGSQVVILGVDSASAAFEGQSAVVLSIDDGEQGDDGPAVPRQARVFLKKLPSAKANDYNDDGSEDEVLGGELQGAVARFFPVNALCLAGSWLVDCPEKKKISVYPSREAQGITVKVKVDFRIPLPDFSDMRKMSLAEIGEFREEGGMVFTTSKPPWWPMNSAPRVRRYNNELVKSIKHLTELVDKWLGGIIGKESEAAAKFEIQRRKHPELKRGERWRGVFRVEGVDPDGDAKVCAWNGDAEVILEKRRGALLRLPPIDPKISTPLCRLGVHEPVAVLEQGVEVGVVPEGEGEEEQVQEMSLKRKGFSCCTGRPEEEEEAEEEKLVEEETWRAGVIRPKGPWCRVAVHDAAQGLVLGWARAKDLRFESLMFRIKRICLEENKAPEKKGPGHTLRCERVRNNEKCYSIREPGSRFCIDHKCQELSCSRARMDGSHDGYCEKHLLGARGVLHDFAVKLFLRMKLTPSWRDIVLYAKQLGERAGQLRSVEHALVIRQKQLPPEVRVGGCMRCCSVQ